MNLEVMINRNLEILFAFLLLIEFCPAMRIPRQRGHPGARDEFAGAGEAFPRHPDESFGGPGRVPPFGDPDLLGNGVFDMYDTSLNDVPKKRHHGVGDNSPDYGFREPSDMDYAGPGKGFGYGKPAMGEIPVVFPERGDEGRDNGGEEKGIEEVDEGRDNGGEEKGIEEVDEGRDNGGEEKGIEEVDEEEKEINNDAEEKDFTDNEDEHKDGDQDVNDDNDAEDKETDDNDAKDSNEDEIKTSEDEETNVGDDKKKDGTDETDIGDEDKNVDNDEKDVDVGGKADDEFETGIEDKEDGSGVLPFDEVFDSPFFNFKQASHYFQQLEKAIENAFRAAMEDAPLLNTTYTNTTEEEIEVDGKKYKVHTSVLKAGDDNESFYMDVKYTEPVSDSDNTSSTDHQ